MHLQNVALQVVTHGKNQQNKLKTESMNQLYKVIACQLNLAIGRTFLSFILVFQHILDVLCMPWKRVPVTYR